MTARAPNVHLSSGAVMPALGLGTWGMGEHKREHAREVAALRLGIEIGMTLVDTAEMYGEGGAEEVTGEAIEDRRDDVFIVSKVYPHNASRRGVVRACERSLKRLGTEHVDLYLLHWRGNVPLVDTVAGFEELRAEGRIRDWGVSNFDRADMEELFAVRNGDKCVANQVLYHLGCRGIEWDLLPWCRRNRVAIMAYSPVGQAKLLRQPVLQSIAAACKATSAQLALAWLLGRGVAAIPKASDPRHVHDNSAASSITISSAAMDEIDRAFPPPSGPTPLALL
jgi:diketogulonate reductase-like aldo/keto reductase